MLDITTNNDITEKIDGSRHSIGTDSRIKHPDGNVSVEIKGKFVPQTRISDKKPDVGEACVVTDIVRGDGTVQQRWFFGTYHGEYWDTWGRGHIATHSHQYWVSQSACVPDLSKLVKLVEYFGIEVPEDTSYDIVPSRSENEEKIGRMNCEDVQEFINRLEERIEKLEEAQKCPLQPTQPYQPILPPYYPYIPDPSNPLGPVVTYDKTLYPDVVKYTTTCTAEMSPIKGVINDPDGSVK